MTLAYAILAHRDPQQLARLVQAISHPDAGVFVHVDGRSQVGPFESAVAAVHVRGPVVFLQTRVRVHYGGFSMVQATLRLLSEIVGRHLSVSHIVLLSGQDYPIKSNTSILEFFWTHRATEFIHHVALPYEPWPVMNRIQEYFFFEVVGRRLDDHVKRLLTPLLPSRSIPGGLHPHGGSQWWCITPTCAEYLLDFASTQRAFSTFFRYTLIPDEHFFHTIVLNSPFAQSVVNDNKRYIHFAGEHPRTLITEDFQTLSASGHLFARKFDQARDRQILDRLDAATGRM